MLPAELPTPRQFPRSSLEICVAGRLGSAFAAKVDGGPGGSQGTRLGRAAAQTLPSNLQLA